MTSGDYVHNSSSSLFMSLSDTDTGFGETYTPTAAEIANFMNGWKMSDSAFAAYSTGTKYWTAVDSPKADFAGKVSASTVENANIAKRVGSQSSLQSPSAGWQEFASNEYSNIFNLDGTIQGQSTSTNTNIAQQLFSFNLIEHVLRKYGSAVFGAAVTTVDRVTWLKANVGKMAANWFGYGSGPAGNKAYFTIWYQNVTIWDSSPQTHTNGSVTKLSKVNSSTISNFIDANGFVHYLAYADASDGTTASTINTDFVELEVNLLVQTLPTGYATTSWTPYKLSYQLATTVEEVVTVEGAINLHTGGNQIEVSEGVVVREKVTPIPISTFYLINRDGTSVLKNKTEKILAVYKNGIVDKKWTLDGSAPVNGKQRAVINATDFDTTAEYTVTYTIYSNDKPGYTAALNSVQADYSTSIKTIVDMTVQRLGDVETASTVNIRAIAELYKRVKALGG
jgi:hypothetical protein